MDTMAKLAQVAQFMHFEPDQESMGKPCPAGFQDLVDQTPWDESGGCGAVKRPEKIVYPAKMPGGKRINLLKTLLTSVCERNCNYCAFRAGRDIPRTSFTPDEMARAFMDLQRGGAAQGIFLSSGMVGGGVRTQDRLIDAAEILRLKLGFRGYLHLKIMPGAERAQVERAMQLADRVSVNLEGPNVERLRRLAPLKVFYEELLAPLRWVEEIRRTQPAHKGWSGRWPSTVTQFVVGGVGENDLELLSTTEGLYRQLNLRRAYFSGFEPIRDTPLENQPPVNPWRQNRLYQASFLLRDYGFDLEDLEFAQDGFLPLSVDPKLAWAQGNLTEAPVEVNRAESRELLRVPGIGPKGVQAIVSERRKHPLRCIEDLRRLGIQAGRAAPFVLLDGKRPPRQASLFPGSDL